MKCMQISAFILMAAALAAACGSSSSSDGGSSNGDDGSSANGSGGARSSSSGTSSGGTNGSGAANSGGVNGSGVANPGGASGSSATTGTYPSNVEFNYDPSKDTQPQTCAATNIDSEEVLLDMFVILDQSGSMTQPFGNNEPSGYCDIGDSNVGSRWCNAINALYGFFEDPSSVGMGAAYGEFAATGCEAFSMDVPLGILQAGDANGHLAAVEAALNDDDPDGGTATEGAIDTLIAETSTHVPGGTRKTIGILITDGNPTRCNENLSELNTLLVNHYTSTGIPTFLIGMTGLNEDNLETMASGAGAQPHPDHCAAAHTTCSYYSVGDGDPAAFMAALDSIRSSVLGCEYEVPAADVGVENLDTLEAKFTPSSSASEIALTRVDEGSCNSASQYWVDFSDGPDPIIKLCPLTCDLRGDGASIAISLKCEGS